MNTFTALSRWVTFVLAVGAGFSVAAIYYAQPLLPLMGQDLNLSITGMGLVPTLTQAGYALGIYGEGNHLILPGEGWINREYAGLLDSVQNLI